MKKLVVLSMVLFVASSVQAASTFYAEDIGTGDSFTRLASWPTATAARDAFLAALTGSGAEVQSFEGLADGSAPGTLPFGSVSATFTGSMTVLTLPAPATNGFGAYPTDGDNVLEAFTNQFEITFDRPVEGFGFMGIDIGDFNGQITLTTVGAVSTDYVFPPTVPTTGSGVLFFGVVDAGNPFTKIIIANSSTDPQYGDIFGFDEMIIERTENPIPAPGAILLGSLGTCLVSWLRRRSAL